MANKYFQLVLLAINMACQAKLKINGKFYFGKIKKFYIMERVVDDRLRSNVIK